MVKLTTVITSIIVVPLIMGLIGCMLATLLPFKQSSQILNKSDSHFNDTTFNMVQTSLDVTSKYIDITFDQSLRNIMLLHNYTVLQLSDENNINISYHSYYGISSIDNTYPLNDYAGYSFASTNYKYGITTMNEFIATYYVNETSVVDNIFRSIYKSSSDYKNLYIGLNNGYFRSYPYNKVDQFNNMYYKCAINDSYVIGYDPRCRQWYNDAINANNIIFTSPYTDAITNTYLISIAKKIEYNNTLIGVVAIDFDMQSVRQISTATVLSNGYSFLIDKSANIIAYPNLTTHAVVNSLEPTVNWQNIIATSNNNINIAHIQKNGNEWFLFYKTNNMSNYILCYMVSNDDITSLSNTVKNTINTYLNNGTIALLIVFIFLIVVAFIITLLISRKYTAPLKELTGFLKNIGKYDLDIELGNRAPVSSEISTVYNNFKALLVSVRFGNDAYYSGDMNKALKNYEQAEILMKNTNNLRGLSICYNNKANVLKQSGRIKEAEDLYLKSINMAETTIKKNNDNVVVNACKIALANRYNNIAVMYKDTGDIKKAFSIFEKSLQLNRETDNTIGIAKTLGNLGQLYIQDNQCEKAECIISEMIELTRIKKDYIVEQYANFNMGMLYIFKQNYDSALTQFLTILSTNENIDTYIQQMCLTNILHISQITNNGQLLNIAGNYISKTIKIRHKHIHFVLDYSGSMGGNPISQCRNSINNIIATNLDENDYISLSIFNESVKKLIDLQTKKNNYSDIYTKILSLTSPVGGTAFYDALINSLHQCTFANDEWIIALTDGDDNRSKYLSRNIISVLEKNKINLIIITVGTISTEHIIKSFCTTANKYAVGIHIKTGVNDGDISNAFLKVVKILSGQLNVESL